MKPYIYETNSVLKLHYDGKITWVRPVIYTFSCKLIYMIFLLILKLVI